MGWRSWWPPAVEAAEGLGSAGWSPDYKSEKQGIMGPNPCVREDPIPGLPSVPSAGLSLEERRILDILRDLRPGQELRIVRRGDEDQDLLAYGVYDILGWSK